MDRHDDERRRVCSLRACGGGYGEGVETDKWWWRRDGSGGDTELAAEGTALVEEAPAATRAARTEVTAAAQTAAEATGAASLTPDS